MADIDVIDYVVVHEIAYKRKNHGKNFGTWSVNIIRIINLQRVYLRI